LLSKQENYLIFYAQNEYCRASVKFEIS